MNINFFFFFFTFDFFFCWFGSSLFVQISRRGSSIRCESFPKESAPRTSVIVVVVVVGWCILFVKSFFPLAVKVQ